MATDQERIELVKRYIGGAREILKRTQDEEAADYFRHLLTRGFIAAPRSADQHGFVYEELDVIEPSLFRKQSSFPIIPLYQEDAALGESIREHLARHPTTVASYAAGTNKIVLHADMAESPFVGGGFLLHEAGHARLALLASRVGQPYSSHVTDDELFEEGRLHALNARLWRMWGDADYQTILEKAWYRIRKMSRGRKGYANFLCDTQWGDVFDRLFGLAPTAQVRKARLALFILYANLELVEQVTWSLPLERRRAEVLRAYYKLGGVL